MNRRAIFRYIRAHAPVGRRQIAEHFGITLDAATYQLQAMKKLGAIRKTGATWGVRWVVADPKADVSSRNGLHVNSLANLRVNWRKNPRKRRSQPRVKHWPRATGICEVWA